MRIIIFGPPGAGKGTQAKLLSSHLSIPHLSTGDILRLKLSDKDELSNKLKYIMSEGKLVSDEVLNKIISDRLLTIDCKNGFILDGYPRTLEQYNYLDLFIKNNNIFLDKIINIEVQEKIIENRIILRSKIENREDDKMDVIRGRLKTYEKETKPVVRIYKENNKNIYYEINGEQKIEEIQSDLKNITIK